MRERPLLDTHAWLWWLNGSGSLTRRERAGLDEFAKGARPYIAAISLWETALLVELGRVTLGQEFDEWIHVAASPDTVAIIDATTSIAKELRRLPSNFHRDPADRLIVSTARALDLPLLTHDGPIRRSKLIRLWRA